MLKTDLLNVPFAVNVFNGALMVDFDAILENESPVWTLQMGVIHLTRFEDL